MVNDVYSVAGSFTIISGGHGTVMMKTRTGCLSILKLDFNCRFSSKAKNKNRGSKLNAC